MADPNPFAEDELDRFRDMQLQRMKQGVTDNPFAVDNPYSLPGSIVGPQNASPKAFFEKPGHHPQDPLTPVYETLSPSMQGYGLGQGVGQVGAHLYDAYTQPGSPLPDLGKAAGEVGLLAAGALIPGAPRGASGGRMRPGHGEPLPENVGIPRAERPGVKERSVKPEPVMPQLDNGFYLESEKALLNTSRKQGDANAWLKELRNVKDAEVQALKLNELFASNPAPSKEQILQHIQANRPQLQVTNYGAPSGVQMAEFTPRYEAAKTQLQQAERAIAQSSGGKVDARTMEQLYEAKKVAEKGLWALNAEKAKMSAGDLKWSNREYGGQGLSVDRSNPTNRETVVGEGEHSPKRHKEIMAQLEANKQEVYDIGRQLKALREEHGITGPDMAKKNPAFLAKGDPLAARREAIAHENQTLTNELSSIESQTYREGHYPEAPGYLFHLRHGLYRDAEGKLQFHIDENQSTRAQQIRDAGGAQDPAKVAELQKRVDEANATLEQMHEKAYQFLKQTETANGVDKPGIVDLVIGGKVGPGRDYQIRNMLMAMAPGGKDHKLGTPPQGKHAEAAMDLLDNISAQTNNLDLAAAEHRAATEAPKGHPLVNSMDQVNRTSLRMALKEAADSGVSGITLTPGSLQNQRYRLSHHVPEIHVEHSMGNDTRYAYLYGPKRGRQQGDLHGRLDVGADGIIKNAQGHRFENATVLGKPLHEVVGQSVADGIMGIKNGDRAALKTGDLEIGGQGMRDYYDRQYPDVLNKELKRLDPNYPGSGTTQLMRDPLVQPPTQRLGEMHHFPLTPEIIAQIKKGLPLFSVAALLALQPETSKDNPFGYD